MSIDSPLGMDIVRYEFHGDTIPDELETSNDSGTITCNTGLSGGMAGKASIVRIDNTNAGDNELTELSQGALYALPSNGHIYMEARIAIEGTTAAVTVGFNDDTADASNTLPVELSTTTFTSNASTFIGVVVDSDATYANWHAFWVDDDVDCNVAIANLNSGIALAASRWYTIRIDVWDAGSGNQCVATFNVTDELGNRWDYRNTSTIDRDVPLCWHIGNEDRTTTANFVDVDYVEFGMSRVAS